MVTKAKIEGEVVCYVNNTNVIKFYSEEVELSDSIKTRGEAMNVLHNGLGGDLLRPKFDGFRRMRTCDVTHIKSTRQKSSKSKDQLEYEDLLSKATKLGCVPENLGMYELGASRNKALSGAIDKFKKRLKASTDTSTSTPSSTSTSNPTSGK